jgi:uncharacterized alkaline shock family protein YloU
MNVFNRIVVVIVLLFLIFLSAIGIVNIYAGFFTWAEIPSLFLSPEVTMSPLIGTLILAGIFIAALLLLIFEFYRRRPKSAAISSDNRGSSMVTTGSVSKEVEQELLKLDTIKDTKVKTIVRKDGVFTDIYAKISKGQNVNFLTEDIRNNTYNFLTQKLGLKVSRINFTITGFIPEKEKIAIEEPKVSQKRSKDEGEKESETEKEIVREGDKKEMTEDMGKEQKVI